MKNLFPVLALTSFSLLAATGFGAVEVTNHGSVSVENGPTAWPGTPLLAGNDNPVLALPSDHSGEGGVEAVDSTYVAQSFRVASDTTLDSIALLFASGGAGSHSIKVYDLGASGTALTEGSYTGGTELVSTTFTIDAGFDYSIVELDFTEADEVALMAGHNYLFEVSKDPDGAAFYWARFSETNSTYADGALFKTGTLANGQNADAAFAVYTKAAATEMWLGYPITDDWADTGDWLGQVYVKEAPWIWTDLGWVYIQESSDSETGAWGWFVK